MTNLITILLAIFAIIITMYASDDLRKKAEENENSFIRKIFERLDEFFFKENTKDTLDNKEKILNKNNIFDENNPLYKYLGLDTPIGESEAKIFFIDLDAINNKEYGYNLLNFITWSPILMTLFAMIPMVFVPFSIHDGYYFNAIIQISLTSLFLFFILKSLTKLSNYRLSVAKTLYSSIFLCIFTKKYIIEGSRNRTWYHTSDIEKFQAECTEKENKLLIYTKQGKSILLHHPVFYKEKLKYQLDYEDIANRLNKYLLEYKEL